MNCTAPQYFGSVKVGESEGWKKSNIDSAACVVSNAGESAGSVALNFLALPHDFLTAQHCKQKNQAYGVGKTSP